MGLLETLCSPIQGFHTSKKSLVTFDLSYSKYRSKVSCKQLELVVSLPLSFLLLLVLSSAETSKVEDSLQSRVFKQMTS